MAKSKTPEEKAAFVRANKSYVPTKQAKWFEEQTPEKQYEKILSYMRTHKKTDKNKLNVKNEVKRITDLNPSASQVKSIIEKLNEWLNSTKERQIAEIEKQIQILNKQKEDLVN